jgi:hypothetical protein
MEAWIAQKAEEDRRRKLSAQTLGKHAESVWEGLRTELRNCVNDFNALYREDPARAVECAETGREFVVSLKSRPEVHVAARLDPSNRQVVYRTSLDHQSTLAAESLIYAGLNDLQEALQIHVDENGAPYLANGEARLGLAEASEKILAPILFPAEER